MNLVVIGVSHKTAPIELRERLAIPPHRLGEALDQLKAAGSLHELVILSTCNRIEIHALSTKPFSEATEVGEKFFQQLYGMPLQKDSFYRFENSQAVGHLFRVACGLDSLVVGETEILGQVKSSYAFSQNHGTTGKITNVLFQRALFVGKIIRNKTAISEGASSVGSIAVRLAERIFGHLKNHHVLLLGAGKMAEVTARHLLSQKAAQLVILNRTLRKAEELAQQLNGRAGPMDDLEKELLAADIVICSTSADKPLITKNKVEGLMKERRMKALYFIDIAVPRNVEPSTHELDNVYVYNIDDLSTLVQENMGNRRAEMGTAETLVEQLSVEFSDWLAAALRGENKPLRHNV